MEVLNETFHFMDRHRSGGAVANALDRLLVSNNYDVVEPTPPLDDNPRTLTYVHKETGVVVTNTFSDYGSESNLTVRINEYTGSAGARDMVASAVRKSVEGLL